MTKMIANTDLILKKLQELGEAVGAPTTVVSDALREIGFSQDDPIRIEQVIGYIIDHGDPLNSKMLLQVKLDMLERHPELRLETKKSLWQKITSVFSGK